MTMFNSCTIMQLALSLLTLLGPVGCSCKKPNPSSGNIGGPAPNNTSASSQPTQAPITQAMINAISVAPGLQNLLNQLQAGTKVDLNQEIDSGSATMGKEEKVYHILEKEFPLHIVCKALLNDDAATPDQVQARLDLMRSLLSRGAKPNLPIDRLGSGIMIKPLVYSVIIADRLDVFKVLLEYRDETFTQVLYEAQTPYAFVQSTLTSPGQAKPFLDALEAVGIKR